MIRFIQPFLDERETSVFQSRQIPQGIDPGGLEDLISQYFQPGRILLADKGEEAIRAVIGLIKAERGWDNPVIAIPAAVCGSVYRAVKDKGRVILMDADQTWNCRPDEQSARADILLFAGLSGKRMPVPSKTRPDQVLIDDSAQCFDGVSGFRAKTDFSIFSFGGGKQMFAGGGVIYSVRHDLNPLAGSVGRNLADWQRFLMLSQLGKIGEINILRRNNGLRLIEGLSGLSWLTLPDPKDHVFAKFIVFIEQGGRISLKPLRTEEILQFMRYMAQRGIQVEETYIPLHVRFPQELNDGRYKDFQANRLWIEAITLPCRPNLTPIEIDQIIRAVRAYQPQTARAAVAVSKNQEIYESKYSSAGLKPLPAEDYFGKLSQIRMDMLRELGRGKKMLDLGCGGGAYMMPLLEQGFDVTGLDFSQKLLTEFAQEWRQKGHDPATLKLIHADAQAIPEANASYDLVFSLSTLYHVPKVENTLAETARILRTGGLAFLELGNLRSFNTIEAKRVSTGVQSYHHHLVWLDRQLARLGLKTLKRRCFQLFPLYGGGTPLAARALNPFLRRLLAQPTPNGQMLDEAVSSGPILSRFAFRHMVLLRKTETPVKAPAQAPVDLNLPEYLNRWFRPEAEKTRAEAQGLCQKGEIGQALSRLTGLLLEDPSDLPTIFTIAGLYDGSEERAFVSKYGRLLERTLKTVRKQKAPTTQIQQVAVPVKMDEPALPKVSVVLPTYNQASMLPKAVNSVLSQTYRDFEFVIVNDGSTDCTREYLDTLRDPRVRVIHQENKRLPGALNAGFSNAHGQYLTWTSSDNICAPYFLEALVGALDAFPQAGLAYADFFFIDNQDRILNRVSNPWYSYRSLINRNDGNAAFLYRRDCQDRIGLYDTELEGAEDWDYWLRIAEQFPLVYVPEALYYYRLHEQSMQSTKKDRINRSAAKTVEKAWARRGGRICLENFYPGLRTCSDQRSARFAAAFDLGTRMLAARVPLRDLSEMLLEDAARILPDSVPARLNLSVALVLGQKWNEALKKLPDLREADGFRDLISKIRGAIINRSQEDLLGVRLPSVTPQSHELMSLESRFRKVFSFTQQTGVSV